MVALKLVVLLLVLMQARLSSVKYVNAHLDPILTHQAFFKKLERKFGVAEKLPAAIKPH